MKRKQKIKKNNEKLRCWDYEKRFFFLKKRKIKKVFNYNHPLPLTYANSLMYKKKKHES